jgi:hypothetical protein
MMRNMRRLHRLVTAFVVVLAIVAGCALPCFCAAMTMSSAAEDAGHAAAHSCCAQPHGVRAADSSCCDGAHDRSPEPWAPAAVLAVSSPAPHVTLEAADLAGPVPALVAPPRPVSASPPLRI